MTTRSRPARLVRPVALVVLAACALAALVQLQHLSRQPSVLTASLVPLVLLVCLAAAEAVRRSSAVALVPARVAGPARVGAALWRVSSASRQCDPAAPGHSRPRAPGRVPSAHRSAGSTS